MGLYCESKAEETGNKAALAHLGERQTEDITSVTINLEALCSIHRSRNDHFFKFHVLFLKKFFKWSNNLILFFYFLNFFL